MQELQRRMLWKALDLLDNSNDSARVVCYSTCSVSVAENEAVVDYIIKERGDCKIIDTGLSVGRNGLKRFKDHQFCNGMELCKRFYPHVHNVQGFFVCLI